MLEKIENQKFYLKEALQREETLLHPKAAFSKEHRRYFPLEEDHRLPYKRDVDRIIHSKGYARYVDKTQVAYLVDNDHITHRGLHVQLVSNFSRGIAEILQLNVDLVEAIALGHDVGHPPFGHEGEGYLSKLSEEFGQGHFAHPFQSCRLFSELEPLNLGFAVYDGFLCHDGGMSGTILYPNFQKSWENHFDELSQKRIEPTRNFMPATLEGCLVKICDTISYIGRDIEDAIKLKIIERNEVPETFLGNSNGKILSALACDIIEMSYGKEYIALSQKAYEALVSLRMFNFKKIYTHSKLKVESSKIKEGYRILFHFLLDNFKKFKEQSFLWKNYLHNKSEKYANETPPVQLIIDYISGMTDHYFIKILETLIIPKPIHLC